MDTSHYGVVIIFMTSSRLISSAQVPKLSGSVFIFRGKNSSPLSIVQKQMTLRIVSAKPLTISNDQGEKTRDVEINFSHAGHD